LKATTPLVKGHEFRPRREPAVVREREERDAVELDLLDARVGVEDDVEEQVAAFVGDQAGEAAGEKPERL
jgi:hypothetical protein